MGATKREYRGKAILWENCSAKKMQTSFPNPMYPERLVGMSPIKTS